MTNRKNKTYKNKGHKMTAWKRDNRLIKTEVGEYEIIIKGKKYKVSPAEAFVIVKKDPRPTE